MGFVVLVADRPGHRRVRPLIGVARSSSTRRRGEIGFWAGFAVFFPAVTGVMAGLGLSGDLRDPGKSIPLGSIAAVATGFVVYLLVPILLISRRRRRRSARRPAGLVDGSLSSAVAGPPRALGGHLLLRGGLDPGGTADLAGAGPVTASHRVFSDRPNGRFERELLPGMVVALAIAIGAVFLGDLNAVAAVVSMFFLTVYGTINLVAAFEVLSGDPSWRPKINVPWPVTLAGGLACIVVMVLINPVAGRGRAHGGVRAVGVPFTARRRRRAGAMPAGGSTRP